MFIKFKTEHEIICALLTKPPQFNKLSIICKEHFCYNSVIGNSKFNSRRV